MVMERRGNRNPHATNNGRHVKKRRKMSRKTLFRLTLAFWLLACFTAGAITELLIDRLS